MKSNVTAWTTSDLDLKICGGFPPHKLFYPMMANGSQFLRNLRILNIVSLLRCKSCK